MGATRVSLADGRVLQQLRNEPALTGGLRHDRVGALLRDRSGLLWIGLWGGGLQRYNPHARSVRSLRLQRAFASSLSHKDVAALLERRDGGLLVGTIGNGKEDLLDQAGAGARPSADAPRLLVVDDEAGNLHVLRTLFGSSFQVVEAADGAVALKLLRKLRPAERPAVILSDQRMPRMTGVELFERVRESLPEAIRIIITGFVDVGVIIDSINRAGIYQFVVKPFDQKQLWLEIERALELFEMRGRNDAEVAALRVQPQEHGQEVAALRAQIAQLRGVPA